VRSDRYRRSVPAQIVARGLRSVRGGIELFGELDLIVAPGDVVGVVGPNGAGKSTLLALLAGTQAPTAGQVTMAPPDATVGWLRQETERLPDESVLAHLVRRTGVEAARADLDAAADALADGDPGAEDTYAAVLERWLTLGAADLEDRAPAVLAQVGLDVDPGRAMTSLSGGQAARAGLAALLLSRFDVLLLDEPTNDLDLEGLELLEQFVLDQRSATVLVSHDREFLRRTVDRVLEIDSHQHAVHHHGGGYDAYLAEREVRRRQAADRYREYADTVAELGERARTQRAWADKGARTARRDRSERDKFIRHHDIATSEQLAAKARRTERMIERLEQVPEPRKEWELQFSIAGAAPSGTIVATLDAATVDRGDYRLGPVSLVIERDDRVAITGPNGAGKTTLIGLLTGELEPASGRATTGASVVVGEIDQARTSLGAGPTLLDAVAVSAPDTPTSELRTLLAKFGLGAEHVLRETATLSPGERTRASLALLQLRGVNLLVLDEPTNHLDLPAIEQLEAAVERFEGTVLLVSHDRRLLEQFRATRTLRVEAGLVSEG
jgi:ATPase subunit of ABC transporter with duplicated ATPase domains